MTVDHVGGLLLELMLHEEKRTNCYELGDRVVDSLRKETVKPMVDYVANLICCLLNFAVAQQLRVY